LLVADINQQSNPLSAAPEGDTTKTPQSKEPYVEMGGYWYFSARSNLTGRELFRTDGTLAGTSLVKDLMPGVTSSTIEQIVAYNNRVWFTVDGDYAYAGLYVTDGTEAGTVRLQSSWPKIADMAGMGGKLYFAADASGTGGTELWVSDGTTAGTQLVTQINPGPTNSGVRYITPDPTGTRILFRASDGVTGQELWSSDGTAAGTSLVADIWPGSGSSNLSQLVHFGGKVYFTAKDGTHGYELWVTDGTTAGTSLVLDLDGTSAHSSPQLADRAIMGGELYFAAGSQALSSELWKTDGTTAGTVPVADIDPAGAAVPADMVALGGRVYFTANVEATLGRELWSTDGTAAGTKLVYDFDPGPSDGCDKFNTNLIAHNSELLLAANDGAHGYELWKTNGLVTSLVQDIRPGADGSNPNWFTSLSPTQVMFGAFEPNAGTELHVTDGTSAGTSQLFEIANQPTNSSDPAQMHAVGGDYFLFVADDGLLGRELYRWDRIAGVTMLADIRPGSASSSPSGFYTTMIAGSWLTFFQANDGVHDQEVWVTDGTAAGTHMLVDLNPNGAGCNLTATFQGKDLNIVYQPVHDLVYFAGTDGVTGVELWATNGTAAGTFLVADIYTGTSSPGQPNGSGPSYLTVYGDLVVFAATEHEFGTELYASDGTAAGTAMVYDLYTGSPSSKPTSFTVFDGRVAFFADSQATGRELFVTDGTTAGTTLVRDMSPGGVGSDPENGGESNPMVAFQGYLYFSADWNNSGVELARTDLTWSGTTLVDDLRPGFNSSWPRDLTVAGDGYLYLSAYLAGGFGQQILRTDGIPGATTRIPFRNYGVGIGTQANFEALSNGVYFTTMDSFGTQVQYTGGGSLAVTTLCTLSTKTSSPGSILADGSLFVMANASDYGSELFRVNSSGASVTDLEMSGSGIQLSSTDPILGSSLTVTVSDPLAPGVGMLVMSSHLGTPIPYPNDPPSALWIDPLSFSVLGVVTGPTWSTTLAVPATPSLIGGQVNLQSWHLPGLVFPSTMSNGLQLVIGN
jgi:ELWxxDGT repeat protein